MSDSDDFIDLSDLRCPLPVLRVKKALGEINAGELLRFFVTDPGAVDDIPAFINQAGHRVLKITPATGGNFFEIRKK